MSATRREPLPGETIAEKFCNAVRLREASVALRQKEFGIWREVTWREFGEHVRRIAMGLATAEPVAAQGPLSVDEEADYDGQIAEWERGSWFSLYDGKEVIKVKLRWISPLRTLFMFSSDADKSARVLSPQTIKSYLKQGWLKPLEAVPLTKRVADRMIGEFERSPKRAEELARRIGAKPEGEPQPKPA